VTCNNNNNNNNNNRLFATCLFAESTVVYVQPSPQSTPELDTSFELDLSEESGQTDIWKLTVALESRFGNDTGRDAFAEILRELARVEHISNTTTIVNAGGSSGPEYKYHLRGANVSERQPDVLWTLRESWAKIVLLLVEVKGSPLQPHDRIQLSEMMVGQLMYQFRVTGLLINSEAAEIWFCERKKGKIYLFQMQKYDFKESKGTGFMEMLRDIGEQSMYASCRLLADPMHKIQ
jgi:hypothetical protein